MERVVFLDFLNREAAAAVHNHRGEADDFAIIEVLLLTHTGRFSANISQMIEYCDDKPRLQKWITTLIRAGILISTSNDPDLPSFIDARQRMYSHDRLRYPMYFLNPEKIEDFRITTNNTFSMTKTLRRDLFDIEEGKLQFIGERVRPSDMKTFRDNIDYFQRIAIREPDAAITKSLFLKDTGKRGAPAAAVVETSGRVFSGLYMSHYAEQNLCAVCTGILKTGFAEDNSSFPFYDIPILFNILELTGYYGSTACKNGRRERSVSHYGSRDHNRFCYLCRALTDSVVRLAASDLAKLTEAGAWTSIRSSVANTLAGTFAGIDEVSGQDTASIDEFLRRGSSMIEKAGERLCKHPVFEKTWRNYVPDRSGNRILVFVATPIEEDELAKALQSTSFFHHGTVSLGRTFAARYVSLGDHEVIVCRTSAGGSGVSGSHLMAAEAIQAVKPRFAIACGICFGFNDKGFEIGDVLVSDHVANYEFVRLGSNEVRERGPIVPAGRGLLSIARDVMRRGRLRDERISAYDGQLLCGEKLVDDPEFMRTLRSRFPDAIGGEMEGVGISSAAAAEGVEWVVVKAICDWGFDKDKKHQKAAASAAARFVADMIHTSIDARPLKR
ncbi:hypothetical protein EJC49_00185 [Aquibium carbonis]|uniref:Nucleoside phosphorylase domain-containing protein n=1 Tax=Aquibium carbonis TaxID=2495581 RepID=A0A429Z408_9HYPH|nr:hypothetical protein [Aquibium carbonis]RST88465.1 hypothetical protein EJC49_00185 [Aquibium carbonis]